MPLFLALASLGWNSRLPDESSILGCRYLLDKHKLVDQILIC